MHATATSPATTPRSPHATTGTPEAMFSRPLLDMDAAEAASAIDEFLAVLKDQIVSQVRLGVEVTAHRTPEFRDLLGAGQDKRVEVVDRVYSACTFTVRIGLPVG